MRPMWGALCACLPQQLRRPGLACKPMAGTAIVLVTLRSHSTWCHTGPPGSPPPRLGVRALPPALLCRPGPGGGPWGSPGSSGPGTLCAAHGAAGVGVGSCCPWLPGVSPRVAPRCGCTSQSGGLQGVPAPGLLASATLSWRVELGPIPLTPSSRGSWEPSGDLEHGSPRKEQRSLARPDPPG